MPKKNIANIYDAPKSNVQFSEGQKSKGILDDYAERQHITFKSLNDRWEDLRTPSNLVKISATKPPEWTDYRGGQVLAFGDEAINEEVVFFTIQMPHGWKEGSGIRPHIHLVPEDATAGNARFLLTYSWANKDGVFGAESSETITCAMPGVANTHKLYSFTEIAGTGKEISSILVCSLTRKSSDVLDTFDGKSVYFLEVDFHYLIDSTGSRQELIK